MALLPRSITPQPNSLHALTSRLRAGLSGRLVPSDWTNRRVTVMGLGRHGGGVGAAGYLARAGARVTISDVADRATLADSLAQLSNVKIAAVKLGAHDEADFRTEFVVVNPAVRPDHPCLQAARGWGAQLTSETELFLRACPARVIGVSGSNGKSTTCSMLASILAAAGRRTWLGGNIGRSLLADLSRMTGDDWVVLEMSSFQLAHLSPGAPLPQVATITNCWPNHLDWHGRYEGYRAAKQRLVRDQTSGGVAVVNACDVETASWTAWLGQRARPSWPLERIPPLAIPGEHNRQNAACAAAAAEVVGASDSVIVAALAAFQGLEHRLQFVAEVAGRRFYNDSKSTTPRATMAALDALDEPVWLLAGGHPKGADFSDLAGAIVKGARGVGLFGTCRETLRSCIDDARTGFPCSVNEHLTAALDWCWRQSRAGDAIVLSPACASFDQFSDFEARGAMFCALVGALATRATNESR